MLQQTRVAAVLDHYEKFLKRFPTLKALAKASESSVLAAWSGLGYYRRARLMHAGARKIVTERNGIFPCTETELRSVPGVGRYTAAAIASIAFGEAVAVVDGNVERVLQRVLAEELRSSELWDCAQKLLPPERGGDFNQAMMELGALVCLPRGPKCLSCPVLKLCKAQGELNISKPVSSLRKKQLRYALNCNDKSVFLVQRPDQDALMPSMWELPQLAKEGGPVDEVWLTLQHSITVTNYTVQVVRTSRHEPDGRWIAKRRLAQTPLTGLARKILIAAELI